MAEEQQQSSPSSVNPHPSEARMGLNLDMAMSDLKPGELTFALNAVTSDLNGNAIKYQNEPGNNECVIFPDGYSPIGSHLITEDNLIVFWILNRKTGDSEIGTVTNCIYTKYINDICLAFDVDHPILKAFHRTTPYGTEVYWTDALNNRRYINLSEPPLLRIPSSDGCSFTTDGHTVDCNLMNVQPKFGVPQIDVESVEIGGNLKAGTYQFAVQYCSADKEPYTSFYSVTNPLSIGNIIAISPNFDDFVGKSIKIDITNIDTSGVYTFINLAVIKSINQITSVDLIRTFEIRGSSFSTIYTGDVDGIVHLTIDDIFQKYPIYERADDIFHVNDLLGWQGLTTNERLLYQDIWTNVHLQWETTRIPSSENYSDGTNSKDYEGYFRDEIYPFEGVFLLKSGFQTDRCPIPGRIATEDDLAIISEGSDIINTGTICSPTPTHGQPRWQVYNTASITGFSNEWKDAVQDNCYKGPYQYGEFAYTESTDSYPCDVKIWGNLAGKPIRHHKFPDSLVTHIHDDEGNFYPIGVRVDVQQIINLINASTLTDEQKSEIVGFKILRGNRINNKSVVARGLINNVLKYGKTNDSSSTTIQSTIQNEANSLSAQALSLTIKAIKILAFQGPHKYYTDGNEAASSLTDLPSLSIGSSEYTASLTYIDGKLGDIASGSSNQTAAAYASGAQSIVESLMSIQAIDPAVLTSSVPSSDNLYYPNYPYNDVTGDDALIDIGITNREEVINESKSRYTFHSPDTHFYQPTLGSVLKLETIEAGLSQGHLVEVKNHAKYQFLSLTSYITAALTGLTVGFASGTYGVSDQPFDGAAAFAAYKTVLDILYKVSPRRNFCLQYNSVGTYNASHPVLNNGNKQRALDTALYAIPGIQSVGESNGILLNNYQRESSVYLKTHSSLPFTHENNPISHPDTSKTFVPTEGMLPTNIASYYATIKNNVPNQYGDIYSYEALDTGFQAMISLSSPSSPLGRVFGGDCFINKFAYKTKLPLFIDNRVGFPDEADVFYDEIGNVGKPRYWFSTDATQHNTIFGAIFGIKPHNWFWTLSSDFTDNGRIILFVYGIPYFFCESEVNVDFRQAFNAQEGDFYPRVSTGVPDEWLQEIHTSIKQDNTYFYNKTYSKQNKENFFSSIPADYDESDTRSYLSHTAIWSDNQKELSYYKHNNWLIYKPDAKFDLPKNFGRVISVDGLTVRTGGILVRYENDTQLYSSMLTAETSEKSVYLGNSSLFRGAPPVNFNDIETGSTGALNKLLIGTPIGPIMCDLKRGLFFKFNEPVYMKRSNMEDMSKNLSSFFRNNLIFFISSQFPDYPVDNHYKDVGLTGIYDPFYKRVIITKKDYLCIDGSIKYIDGKLLKNDIPVELSDTRYFINKSFTFSFGLDIMNFVSLHSYAPNYYVPGFTKFYSGINDDSGSSLWIHLTDIKKYNSFYGKIYPYILEYPYSYKMQDEILQNIKDYSRVLMYNDDGSYIETNDVFFNKAILRNEQQCSGILNLVPKPKHSLKDYMKYPIYSSTSKTITYTKSDSFYNYNTFWSLVRDSTKPIFIPSNEPSMFSDIDNTNMNYSKMSYGKAPLRSRDLRIRHILDNTSRYKVISEFLLAPTVKSFK